MDELLENYQNSPKKVDNLNSPQFIKAIDFVVKSFTTKKTPCPEGFTGNFYWTFKQELM